MRKRMGKLQRIAVWIVLIVSTLIFLYPNFKQLQLKWKAAEDIAGDEKLWDDMETYNEKLRKDGQELTDCWSYEQTSMSEEQELKEGDVIGAVRIPSIDVDLPLYLGATNENMAKGATVLSETSMPVGGESTNCVIATHRGYKGMPYFRRIDEIKTGDKVEIQNAKETLVYIVERMEIIEPTDLTCLEIQPGRDMVTLFSCHPYMGHSRFRYVVYCVREGTQLKAGQSQTEVSQAIQDNAETLAELKDAEEHIPLVFQREAVIRKVLGVFFVVVWVVLIWDAVRSFGNTRKKRKIS